MAPKKVLVAEGHENATWKLNSLVLCRYLQSPADVYYEAKIINIKHDADGGFIYRIHYQGWNSRHDESISEKDAKLRFKVYTEKDAELAKKTIKQVLQNTKKRLSIAARPRSSVDDSDRAMDTPSPLPTGDPYKKVYLTSGASAQRQQQQKQQAGKRAANDCGGLAVPPLKRRDGGKSAAGDSTSGLKFENVTLSDKLGGILKLDHMLVREMCFLPILPAPFTIDQILEKYASYLKEKSASAIDADNAKINDDANIEFVFGLRDYFNVLLKSRFLYAFERSRHDSYLNELYKTEDPDEVRMSAHYGLPHLLRLIVRLPETLASSNIPCNEMTVAVMKYRASVFVQFLHLHWAKMFNGQNDYEPASLNYMTNATVQTPLAVPSFDKTATYDYMADGGDGSNKENEFNRFPQSAVPLGC